MPDDSPGRRRGRAPWRCATSSALERAREPRRGDGHGRATGDLRRWSSSPGARTWSPASRFSAPAGHFPRRGLVPWSHRLHRGRYGSPLGAQPHLCRVSPLGRPAHADAAGHRRRSDASSCPAGRRETLAPPALRRPARRRVLVRTDRHPRTRAGARRRAATGRVAAGSVAADDAATAFSAMRTSSAGRALRRPYPGSDEGRGDDEGGLPPGTLASPGVTSSAGGVHGGGQDRSWSSSSARCAAVRAACRSAEDSPVRSRSSTSARCTSAGPTRASSASMRAPRRATARTRDLTSDRATRPGIRGRAGQVTIGPRAGSTRDSHQRLVCGVGCHHLCVAEPLEPGHRKPIEWSM